MLPERPLRYASLDVWRGIACLAVVLFHASGYAVEKATCLERIDNATANWADYGVLVAMLGWLGVPIFFVISGYCITTSAVKRTATRGTVLGFLKSRFWRIYPPLWFFLIVTILAVALLPLQWNQSIQNNKATGFQPLSNFSGWNWFGMFTLTEQWRHHIIGPKLNYLVGTLWTLCYEEQFYIVIAIIMLLGRRWLFPMVSTITVLVFLNTIDQTILFGPEWGHVTNQYRFCVQGFFFDGLWLAFAAGVGVYYRTHCAKRMGKWVIDALTLSAFIYFARFVPGILSMEADLPGYLAPAFGFALLLSYLHPADGWIMRRRVVAPLAWCGRMCYSLYLVHGPIAMLITNNCYQAGLHSPRQVLLITTPLTLLISVAIAYLFHRLIERWFLPKLVSFAN